MIRLAGLAVLLTACRTSGPSPTGETPSRTTPPDGASTPLPVATATPAGTPTALLPPTPTPAPALDPEDFPLSGTAYVLPLTIQHTTPTSATLLFELDAPSAGVLVYGPAEGGPATLSAVDLPPTETRHQITLEGLAPGTTYRAAVGLSEGEGLYTQPAFMGQPWGTVQFRTLPEEPPLRIGVIGDSGFGQPVTFELAEEMARHDLDFVLHTGDLVYRAFENASPVEAYALKWYLPFAPLLRRMPVYPVVGNHDIEAASMWEGAPFYYYAFPPFPDPDFPPSAFEGRNQWYAFAWNDIQFLMLDTQTFFGEAGRAEQDAWLAERLADRRFAHTIPVFHVPPYSSGPHGATDSLPVRLVWGPLFEAVDVPLVLSGHDHDYERLLVNGITYVVSGGGSATIYEMETLLEESQAAAQRAHFVLLEITADRIVLSAIAPDGEVFDQAVIPLEAATSD